MSPFCLVCHVFLPSLKSYSYVLLVEEILNLLDVFIKPILMFPFFAADKVFTVADDGCFFLYPLLPHSNSLLGFEVYVESFFEIHFNIEIF